MTMTTIKPATEIAIGTDGAIAGKSRKRQGGGDIGTILMMMITGGNRDGGVEAAHLGGMTISAVQIYSMTLV